jgi:hypothetical protein
MTEKTKPAAEVKIGLITGTIWKNPTEKGTHYNVTFARLYKKGEQWKRSTSFGPDDLPNLAAVAERAAEKITELMAAEQPN